MGAIGIIGGSGLYRMDGFEASEELSVDTPFGKPSDAIVRGRLNGVEALFLARHARGHRLLPSEVPYRANIHALKQLGATTVIGVSAVGSLREEIEPGHLVFIDQYIDRTYRRAPTFFGDGCVAHVEFADPVCETTRRALVETAVELETSHHDGGTFVCMEGPQFSTRAESALHRSWGAHVIGMTNLHEAKLCREAELCYAAIALATDYDCWKRGDEVSVDDVIATLRTNIDRAQTVLAAAAPRLAALRCEQGCRNALAHAIMTAPDQIPAATRARLEVIAGRHLRQS